jgi:hypothetical protein
MGPETPERTRLKIPCFAALCFLTIPLIAAEPVPAPRATVLIAVGAGGQSDYEGAFQKWAGHWRKAATAGNARATLCDGKDALKTFQTALAAEPKDGAEPLWIALLGHGTFDGKDGKFNLPGDDLTASNLAAQLKDFHRPLIVVCGFSAGGSFLKPLSAPGRVIVAATRAGSENNFARFGGYFAEAIADSSGDLDKDGQTSVLEAWLSAAQRVTAFYKDEGRLATEHSLLDDNGDGSGTPPDWFKGVRVIKKSKDKRPADGLRAHQIHLVESAAERRLSPEARARRDALEVELAALRETRAGLEEPEYSRQLEVLLLKLARLYQAADAAPAQ